jgi:hypothetical protein
MAEVELTTNLSSSQRQPEAVADQDYSRQSPMHRVEARFRNSARPALIAHSADARVFETF